MVRMVSSIAWCPLRKRDMHRSNGTAFIWEKIEKTEATAAAPSPPVVSDGIAMVNFPMPTGTFASSRTGNHFLNSSVD